MYAIIESCGRQYKVAEGEVVFFEKLDAEEGKKVTFENVVMVSEDGKVQVGNPYVKGVKVEGKVVSHGKQPYTKVEITSIKTATKKESAEAETKKAETTTKKVAEKAEPKKETAKVEA